jgi:hypothetical protein
MPQSRNPARLALGLTCAALLLALGAVPVQGFAPVASERQEADPLTPPEAGFLVSVNVRQLLDAPLIKKQASAAIAGATAKDERLSKLLKASGLDPLKDIDSLTITGTVDLVNPRGFAVLRGRFQPDKILEVVAEHAKQHPDKLKLVKEGSVQIVEVEAERGKQLFLAFADSKTLIGSMDKAYTAELVGKATKAPSKISKNLQSAIQKLTGKEFVWLAVVVSDQIKEAIKGQNKDAGELIGSLESVTGGIELTDAVNLAVVLHTTDATGAASIRKKIEEFLPVLNLLNAPDESGRAVKEILNTLKVDNDKNSVRISLQVTEDAIKKAAPKKDK